MTFHLRASWLKAPAKNPSFVHGRGAVASLSFSTGVFGVSLPPAHVRKFSKVSGSTSLLVDHGDEHSRRATRLKSTQMFGDVDVEPVPEDLLRHEKSVGDIGIV